MKLPVSKGWVDTYWHSFSGGDEMALERVQDVEAILNNNKRLANEGKGYSPSRELRRVASIPLVIYEQWMQEDMPKGKKDQAAWIKRKLRDPEWRFLRTSEGGI